MRGHEDRIEAELQALGKTAPRLTPDVIDAIIDQELYWQPVGTTLTVCVLILQNGFTVIGSSASASLANFDPTIGRKIAYNKAREKIWELEGYLLRSKLHAAG